MGKGDRSSSATRSRSPRDIDLQTGHNIPALFRSQQRGPQLSSQASIPEASTQAVCAASYTAEQPGRIPSPSPCFQDRNALLQNPSSHPTLPINSAALPLCLGDMQSIAADIKRTLSAAITDLRLDLQSMTERLDRVEMAADRQSNTIVQIQTVSDRHTLQLREMHRHLEDIDNRGRRHNLRVRGLPETIDPGSMNQCVIAIFNSLLDRPPDSPIELERIHRALHPKGRDTDPPRDIICCLVNFPLKEEILRRARERRQIQHKGADIKLFQDLSPITLQHRRDLRPLLEVLRSKNISYRWKFPFCLSASTMGRNALLRTPEDLDHFCHTLDIPIPLLPDWYSDHRLSAPWHLEPPEDPMDWNPHRHRRQRSPPHTPPQARRQLLRSSPSASPAHRRSRPDPRP